MLFRGHRGPCTTVLYTSLLFRVQEDISSVIHDPQDNPVAGNLQI
jgi:hypothetical protein